MSQVQDQVSEVVAQVVTDAGVDISGNGVAAAIFASPSLPTITKLAVGFRTDRPDLAELFGGLIGWYLWQELAPKVEAQWFCDNESVRERYQKFPELFSDSRSALQIQTFSDILPINAASRTVRRYHERCDRVVKWLLREGVKSVGFVGVAAKAYRGSTRSTLVPASNIPWLIIDGRNREPITERQFNVSGARNQLLDWLRLDYYRLSQH